MAAGEVLFNESQPADDWWVLLEGSIALVRQVGARRRPSGR